MINNIYSKGNNDECYTPKYVVEEILHYLPKDKIYWLPFDTDESEFVKVLKENGYRYINSHISYGQDYYTYEPVEWDIMLSNPPFTDKRKIFERALSLNKPFALLMTNTWLNDTAPKRLFFDKELQLFMFTKRINFDNVEKNKITFGCSFYCYDLLPKQIIISDK